MTAKFGPAGTPNDFEASGYKGTLQMPEYLAGLGLSAFEYQCGRGVNIGREKAAALGEKAREHEIALSVHAPYFISLSSKEEAKRENSINYILQSARAVDAMGGTRIVVHSGSCSGFTREQALELALATMKKAVEALDAEDLSHIRICPETMGKIGQLGTLEEVMKLCELDERMLPCIDFGHLNARTHGGLKTKEDFEQVFLTIRDRLGESRLRDFHSHFSKIEYTEGGEKRHLTFETDDAGYGPDFEPVAELCYQYGCAPVFICESAGTQAKDALEMQRIYRACAE